MEVVPSDLLAWLVVVAALIGVPVLLIRESEDESEGRFGPWLLAGLERLGGRLNPEEAPDPLVEAFRAQARREKLVADVQRLRRLVATDMAMSATRQLGNRIAYASLVSELEALREVPEPFPSAMGGLAAAASVPAARWADDLVLSPSSSRLFGRDDGQRAPAVEVLELGSGRRMAH